MKSPIIATKLFKPALRPEMIRRPHLIARLDQGRQQQLILVSAPAGFGKTTLVSEWVSGCGCPAAWLSLDSEDNDPTRFLSYLLSSLQMIQENTGNGISGMLESSQPPQPEFVMTILLNEISSFPAHFYLVLDDYHVIDAKPVNDAFAFLLEHLPHQMHLVIVTREDPALPLARLRARGQLSELRAADLRFSCTEAADFLCRVMGLHLSDADIADLENRTEGWIAGLQLAAVSMRGLSDTAGFIRAFTGSNRYVLDYLIEEVLQQQPESVKSFLLRTSILDRMSGPLCDAVLLNPSASGQEILEYLERCNLFIVPLDTERRWYRYHHLFAELLRQRFFQSMAVTGGEIVAQYHVRASEWYDENGFELDAFHHAASANDIDRVERIIDGKGIPLHLRGATTTILAWLDSLPAPVLKARPSLMIRHASLLLASGQAAGVEEKLDAAEEALQHIGPDDATRNLIGQIAVSRATIALTRYRPDVMVTESRRALEYLRPDNLAFRFSAVWLRALACQFMGDRMSSCRGYAEALTISHASGDVFSEILAETGLGQTQESENQLFQAAECYRHILLLSGDHPQPNASEAHLGLARILYEWNDLDAAEQHGQSSLQLARQYDESVDRFIFSEIILSRVRLARGDSDVAAEILAQAEQSARRKNFTLRMPDIAAAQVQVLLSQDNPKAAALLAEKYELPISRAKIHIYKGEGSGALALLEPLHEQLALKGWNDELLKVMVLEAVSCHVKGEKEKACDILGKTLLMAEPGGFTRLYADEGIPMVRLLTEAAEHADSPEYIARLLAAMNPECRSGVVKPGHPNSTPVQSVVEPLSQRELEILRLVARGYSNQEICSRLFLALDTVKGHNRRIFEKLHVGRRTEAVACARELGLI
jgi:LuxR family transcriptional regulator, maltose regulon positive regulatory protein